MTDPADLPYRPCVGVMLLNRTGQVFVGQRLDTTLEAWQMPQGGIDDGEDPRTAALRELVEETGVAPDKVEVLGETPGWVYYDLPPELLGKVWGGRFGGQCQKWVLMRFLGDDGDIRIDTDHPEFEDWRWMPAAALLDNIVPFKRSVYEEVLAAFQGWLR